MSNFKNNGRHPIIGEKVGKVVNSNALIDRVIDIVKAEDIGLGGDMSDELFAEFSKDSQTAAACLWSTSNITKQKIIARLEKMRK